MSDGVRAFIRLVGYEHRRLHASRKRWRRLAALYAGITVGVGALASVVAVGRDPDAITALLAATIAFVVQALIVRHTRWRSPSPLIPGEDAPPQTP